MSYAPSASQLPIIFKEKPMPQGSKLCPECQRKVPTLGKCECGCEPICDHCRQEGAHAGHWLLHSEWVRRMRKQMHLARKPGYDLAVRKEGPDMHLGGRPRKKLSPILGNDLNRFLSGISDSGQRSLITHGEVRGY